MDARIPRAWWARDRMARYKAPRQVVFVDDLPRTGTRKVRRDSIVPLFEDPAAGQYPVSAWTGSDRRIGDQRAGRDRGRALDAELEQVQMKRLRVRRIRVVELP